MLERKEDKVKVVKEVLTQSGVVLPVEIEEITENEN